ncbi:MAG: alpha/beta hydrolase [bacterium]|nr:alpha/beta hydrolase [bacterium]
MKINRIICTLLVLTFVNRIFAQEVVSINKETPLVIGEKVEIQSKIFNENRVLNIYLPEGYSEDSKTDYPVIYLFDGSIDEDFIHVVGLVQYYNFEWLKIIPKSIVVGIGTVDRRRDFTFPTTIEKHRKLYPTSGHSDKFISFIEKELQPFIENKYKTNSTKTIIGQSMGGLIATEILLKKPTLFNKYIIVSPSLWWDNGSLLKANSEILKNSFKQQTDIYIGVGKEGVAPFGIERVMEVDANLLADKIKRTKSKNVKVHFDYLPEKDHATVMHQAVSNALRLINSNSQK